VNQDNHVVGPKVKQIKNRTISLSSLSQNRPRSSLARIHR